MKTEQKKWIEETLASLDGAGRAVMPDHLRERILQMPLPARGRSVAFLSGPKIWLAAAGLALLLGLNIYAVRNRPAPGQDNMVSASRNPLADEYFAPAPSI